MQLPKLKILLKAIKVPRGTNANPNSSWLFDSGASHHITNDLQALSLHAPYDGTEELIIGDGLPIPPTTSSGKSQPRDL
ncbi:hypothetical protein QVD17_39622 [Tagetes erecta]|uniref:Uncharacterized protein n=1 Tax=Tagetes erecta TaxID=13708 RepID=A0AAD8JQD4_TARER|nr:hypothetical protein QVD17_39622 [Tagetes erecta]